MLLTDDVLVGPRQLSENYSVANGTLGAVTSEASKTHYLYDGLWAEAKITSLQILPCTMLSHLPINDHIVFSLWWGFPQLLQFHTYNIYFAHQNTGGTFFHDMYCR